ncbi:MAG: polyphenol oxidase family protein [Verrucomicrobiota bacterium]
MHPSRAEDTHFTHARFRGHASFVPEILTFPHFQYPQLQHAFTLRQEDVPGLTVLEELGFEKTSWVFAEQIHGDGVAIVSSGHCGQVIPAVDALIAYRENVALVIRTADCAPLFLFDPIKKIIALAHSGKRGTAVNIAGKTIQKMGSAFQVKPENIVAVLGPCIRPPHYEIDFAADIARQVAETGVQKFFDCGLNTGANLDRFYSYRVEQGKTGRHYSVMMLTGC